MRKALVALAVLLAASGAPALTMAHGACSHEAVHLYSMPGSVGLTHDVASEAPASLRMGAVRVLDTETGDCDGDGVPGDFDGDYDAGVGGFAFGHLPWATHCGHHVEAWLGASITMTDIVFGSAVSFVTGADDMDGFLFDPETGENTCMTDGLITPEMDPDDCVSPPARGTQLVTCSGGGDGLLWGLVAGFQGHLGTWSLVPSLDADAPGTAGTVVVS